MELDDLKSMNMPEDQEEMVSKSTLKHMTTARTHPVLRKIRLQLSIESIGWVSFLAVYYDLFDGHLRSIFWNFALILAVGLILIHNLLGYRITSEPFSGPNLLESLRNYLHQIRRYAFLSVSSRVMAFGIVMGYFLSAVPTFEARHYGSIALLGLIAAIQFSMLWRVWSERINRIASSYRQLSSQ